MDCGLKQVDFERIIPIYSSVVQGSYASAGLNIKLTTVLLNKLVLLLYFFAPQPGCFQ